MFIRLSEILAAEEMEKRKQYINVHIYYKITKLFSYEKRQAAEWEKKVAYNG